MNPELADSHAVWLVAIGLGAVVVLVVIALMLLLLSFVKDIEQSVETLLETTADVSRHTSNIPKLVAIPPVLNLVLEEAVVQDGYMNALADAWTAGARS